MRPVPGRRNQDGDPHRCATAHGRLGHRGLHGERCPDGVKERRARAGSRYLVFRKINRGSSTEEKPRPGRLNLQTRRMLAVGFGALLASGVALSSGRAEEQPRRGGTLTYMIPADAPPSLDGHREGTFAMLHATAPFYSVLMRVNPENPSDTTSSSATSAPRSPSPPMTARPTRSRSARA